MAVSGIAREVRVRRLPLGVLVDSVPFARVGMPAVTIARLDWQTFRLIHTPQDTPDTLVTEAATKLGMQLAPWTHDAHGGPPSAS
jgi:Iap family predicted aminopeptidase